MSNYGSRTRYFTTNTQLLLISSTPPVRPQLPFLHTPSTTSALPSHLPPHPLLRGGGGGTGGSGNPLLPRALSTERRQKITKGLKLAAMAYAIIMLSWVLQQGLYQQKIEKMFPTPPDWPFWARWDLRCARALQAPELFGRAGTNWAKVAVYYRDLFTRVEGPGGEALRGDDEGKKDGDDGDGDGEIFIQGVGKVFDIQDMSEPWKKGYFEALMGAAEAAEKLDGWVRDTKTRVVAPSEYVVGPGNPNHHPPPPGKTERNLPREENCVPVSENPEAFYLKVLTTPGFQTNQRMDAALAYADWLDFKGLKSTASATYEWAIDIAASGAPSEQSSTTPTSTRQEVVDRKTGILKEQAPSGHVTENILRASTAMGVHQVRQGDLASALSIFLSVLRARQNLPQPSPSSSGQKPKNQSFSAITSSFSSFLANPPYPTPVRTGDEHAIRTNSSACEEAGLMVYIGEIIYAASSAEHGLSWTRDGVDTAEAATMRLQDDIHSNDSSYTLTEAEEPSFGMQFSTPQKRCQDCLKAGLDNWKTMVRKLVVRAENEELEAIDRANRNTKSTTSLSSWLWPWWSRRATDEKLVQKKMQQRRRWDAEEMILKDRAGTMSRLIGDEGMVALTSGSGLVMS